MLLLTIWGLTPIYSIIVIVILFVVNRINSFRINKFDEIESQRITDLEKELQPQNQAWEKVNQEISKIEKKKSSKLVKFQEKRQINIDKLSELEEIILLVKYEKELINKKSKDQDKMIEGKINKQKRIEIERERKTKNVEKLKSEIKVLEASKKQLWQRIRHLIPYSNLV